jgi:hypothetical protein
MGRRQTGAVSFWRSSDVLKYSIRRYGGQRRIIHDRKLVFRSPTSMRKINLNVNDRSAGNTLSSSEFQCLRICKTLELTSLTAKDG